MHESRYFALNEKDKAELDRLILYEQIWDPITIRHLEINGVSKGWHCLEVGAGAGSIAKWLSARVGPTGKVVSTDINTRFLNRLSLPNLEIRQHDIVKDDLEASQYDLVHSRGMLAHLREFKKGLKRMADAVRPGGWLMIEEFDLASSLSNDLTNPSSMPYTSTLRALFEFLQNNGIMNPFFGRHMRGLIEHLGFTDVGQEGLTGVVRGGGSEMRLSELTVPVVEKPMVTAGLLSQEQLDRVQLLFSDPDFYCIWDTIFAAWGKRPFR